MASGSIFVSFLSSKFLFLEIDEIASLANFNDWRINFSSLLAVSNLLLTISASSSLEDVNCDNFSYSFLLNSNRM